MDKLEGKVTIVTGGTSGIGAGCAELFSQNGAITVIVGRNDENGLKIESRIREAGGSAKYIHCDVTVESDVKQMTNTVAVEFGKIDILVNNAGVMLPSVEIERLDYQDWKRTIDVNVNGYFLVTKYAKPYLLQSKGVILNNASIAGMHSYAIGRSYAYSASKAAIIQFTRMMAKNYAEEGIRVNCISPGIILTPILHGRDPKIYEERIPMKRVGTPEDVAKVALFLVSDESAYLTGVNIPIDGGTSL
jgi:NAD(P)-dependent dehydrogenase (short-subunit alcohol dehydrogenase family)